MKIEPHYRISSMCSFIIKSKIYNSPFISFFFLVIFSILHKSRYEYTHDRNLILENYNNFENADDNDNMEPIFLRGKYWAFIKEDITDAINVYKQQKAS